MKNNINNFLLEQLKKQYSTSDINKILDGYSKKKFMTFRVNTLKSTKEEVLKVLKEKDYNIKEVSWNLNAFVVLNKTEEDIRKLDIYDKGYIYLQSLSSMLPVMILNPKEKEHILDMTASPGSKTTQIAMQTKNKACITAIEKNKIRSDRLKYNLEKQGVTCCTVMNIDSRNLDTLFSFDKILLDAPCSGSGTLSINNLKQNEMFTKDRIEKIKSVQISLLKKALSILKPNQKMVYSTCSILSFENEEVINEVMKEFSIKIIPIKIDSTIPLLPTKINGTVCVCPNEFFEGFFISLIEKVR